jgi:tRNA (guanine-N7-)-methyltransferase
MGKNKLKKFAKVKDMAHVYEPTMREVLTSDFHLKGKWHEAFGNSNPIVLELACGKGEYSVGMGRLYPEKNFIGIDIKGARMYSGAQQVEDEGMTNVKFLRTKIDLITKFFAAGEVAEVWILFADPQLGKARKRLTHPMFLERYIRFLAPGGELHLKTDSDDLYAYTRDEGVPTFNLESKDLLFEKEIDTDQLYEVGIQHLEEVHQKVMNIRTYYEQIWLDQGKKIKYLKYRLDRS